MAGIGTTASAGTIHRPAPEQVRRIVRESLRRELETRRGRAPHAQLGVVVGADRSVMERAYLRLRAHFDPDKYAAHGPEVVVLAGQIRALIESAYAQLDSPAALALARERRWVVWLRALILWLMG